MKMLVTVIKNSEHVWSRLNPEDRADDTTVSQTNFYQAEEASKALQKVTKDLLADSLSSKTSVWNRRSPAQAAANQVLLQSPQTFEDLEMVIQRLEKEHLRNQNKVCQSAVDV